jgi:hypothetical protein
LEWHEEGENIVVRSAARFSSADLHEAIFTQPPEPRRLGELKAGVEAHAKRRHVRR